MTGSILSNDQVRLVRDLPELDLRTGSIGLVLSAWFYPTTAYEVKFGRPGHSGDSAHRLLLLEGEVVRAGEDASL